jgi:hypothetical protein
MVRVPFPTGHVHLSMPIPLGVEEQGRQTSTDFYAVAAGDPKAVYGVSDRDRAEQLQSAWSRAKISDGISTMRGFVARTVDG